jgi:hypothetical protein
MANTTLTADIICDEALAMLENELGVLNTLHRAYEDEFEQKVNGYNVGDTVSIRRPPDFTVRTGANISTQDVIEGKVQLVVNTQKGVDFQFTSTELTLKIEELSERVIKPAMSSLINDIALDVFTDMYRNAYEYVGTPGTRVTTFAGFSKAPERMDECAIPAATRGALLCPSDNWGLVGGQTSLFNGGLVNSAYTEGNLGRVAGLDTYCSQVCPAHTVGPLGGSPLINGGAQNVTYDTAKNTWTQSLITDGWTAAAASRVKEGDIFTIANVFKVNPKTKATTAILQQFVVRADGSSDGSGNLTMTISPPIITSGPHQTVNAVPADNAALTFLGTASTAYRQNMAYHKTAMALAFVPMVMPQAAYNGSRRSYKGMSVRLIPIYDGSTDISKWRLDVLYGKKAIDPRKIVRFGGT